MNQPQPAVHWIDSDRQFEEAASKWRQLPWLAIDTEFERRTTYYPKLALVQVYDGENIFLIDSLTVSCADTFQQICADPNIVKIFHAGKEDLETFGYNWRCFLKGIFDTQVACAFATGEVSLGYGALVEQISGTRLAKSATQSDWLARPLSDSQLNYAAEDVRYLPELYRQLTRELDDKGLQSLFQQECEELSQWSTMEIDLDVEYRNCKEAWRLNGEQLALLKRLYRWREETAIQENRTRNHILRDAQLIQVVIRQPTNRQSLQGIEGVHPRSVRLYTSAISQIVTEFQEGPAVTEPLVVNPRDLPRYKSLYSSFEKSCSEVAKAQGLAVPVLASKRYIRKLTYAYLTGEAFPASWHGWRGRLLKPELDAIFSQLESTK